MKIYLITDTHFNHRAIINLCGRPLNYERVMFRSMNNIAKEDVLLHLGDICIGKDVEVHEKYIKPLKCKKWLVLGNHDRKSYSWYYEHGWDLVTDGIVLKVFGQQVLFTHTPRPIGRFDLNIHGHFHNSDHRLEDPGKKARYKLSDIGDKHKLLAVEYSKYQVVDAQKFVREAVIDKDSIR